MLLDYDRVFSAMGVPACLWRRTGEIYKGNREFTELVGVDGYMMRDVSSDSCLSILTFMIACMLCWPVLTDFLFSFFFFYRDVSVFMNSWQKSQLSTIGR